MWYRGYLMGGMEYGFYSEGKYDIGQGEYHRGR